MRFEKKKHGMRPKLKQMQSTFAHAFASEEEPVKQTQQVSSQTQQKVQVLIMIEPAGPCGTWGRFYFEQILVMMEHVVLAEPSRNHTLLVFP